MPRTVMLVLFASLVGLCAWPPAWGAAQQKPAAAPADAQERGSLLDLQRAAEAQLQQARLDGATADQRRKALLDAGSRIGALANGSFEPALREELRRAASDLTALASGDLKGIVPATAPVLALLERVKASLDGNVALGLSFQGSFSQTKPKEPAYGGHASSMGPAPPNVPSPDDGAPVLVTFEQGAQLGGKAYCGGPNKDHILESACGGVALFDYDGDGHLDIYLVTGAGLTASRERIAHRNTLYRGLGGWKFEDVSKQAGVDLAAWGSGVCVGDSDGDGRLDLYVTNWGSNALFRNRGDGTFEEIAARAGVA